MSLPAIDFRRIRGYGPLGSQADGFEELATQLLEDELVTWPAGTRFERFGNPDGGREGRGLLPDGQTWAWQTKFLFELDASEFSQITKSVKRVVARETALTKYFVVVPYDYPAGDTAKSKSAHTKWLENVEAWKALAVAEGLEVDFEFVGAHRLVAALTKPSQVGRLRYWFDINAFSHDWFVRHVQRAAADAGPRYTPELHVSLPIADVFEGLGQTADFALPVRTCLAKLRSARRYGWLAPADHEAELAPLITAASNHLDTLDAALVSVVEMIEAAAGEIPPFEERLTTARTFLTDLGEAVERLCLQEHGYTDLAASLYTKLRHASDAVRELATLCEGPTWRAAQQRLLVLSGEGGTGKTHLFCDVAKARAENRSPTLVVLGQNFDGRAPLMQLAELTQFAGAPGDLLPTLNAAAQAAGRRGLVMIDALNESDDPDVWLQQLPGLVRDIIEQPWLGVAVSCRTPYLDSTIPEAVREQAAVVIHTGFQDATSAAVTRYLAAYGIEAPSFPLMDPELTNPLFLRLLCAALKSRGIQRFPRSQGGMLWLYDAYLQAIDERLSSSRRCDYDPSDRLVARVVHHMAKAQIEGDWAIPHRQARELTDQLLPDRKWSSSLLKGLFDEGVLTRIRRSDQDRVVFGYQRLGDIAVAALLCEKPIDEIRAVWESLLRRSKMYSGVNAALAVTLPEKHGVELVDLIAESPDQPNTIGASFLLDGLPFRSVQSISERTVEVVNNMFFDDRRRPWALGTTLGLTTVPEHPLNADWLHQHLIVMSLPERDLTWTQWCRLAWLQGPIERLITWAWSTPCRGAEDEVVRLSAVVLAWFLTSNHRPLRDRATKAMVHLLEHRPNVYRAVLEMFVGVNDPYVWERLLAVGCGLALRTRDNAEKVQIGECVASSTVLADRWPEHILARDYARRAIETAIWAGWQAPENIAAAVRPPYGQRWPVTTRTTDEIDALTGAPDYKYGSIAHSVLGEFGDFNKYIIASTLSDLALPDDEEAGVVARRVFDRVLELGWTPERFDELDQAHSWEPTAGNVTERIGKKYQWIAFHETLGAIVDNHAIRGGAYGDETHPYDDPADLDLRDIDPSMILPTRGHADFYTDHPSAWWAPDFRPFQPHTVDWLETTNDLPDPASLILVNDHARIPWLTMEGHYQWTESIPPEDVHIRPRRRIWYQIRSYIGDAAAAPALEQWARNTRFSGRWMPEAGSNSGVLLGDYPHHPTWYFAPIDDYRSRRDRKAPTQLTATTAFYSGANSYDQSAGEPVRAYLPSRELFELLQLRPAGDFRWSDDEGCVIAEDFATRTPGPAAVHVRADQLTTRSQAGEKTILWTVVGEKQIIRRDQDAYPEPGTPVVIGIEAVYLLDAQGIRLVQSTATQRFARSPRPERKLHWGLS